ncbi:hypothetical protein MM221_20965 [Salipaludibacillus sp. LMS25]|uniref:hypothetical protein n=1 Tax=Salipaludibacillus sp. LMS25 TaxID=2924031 RepID=UPI0020D0E76E|nr:hypothetical protein [Salipaludibacillus sp. LMS25]UTR14972.1 hypothetical protein MM221_20965 [Salipaludibacillus sp. LMS25]
MIKKMAPLALSAIMILTLLPAQVSASNHVDTKFAFRVSTSNNYAATPGRAKHNTTSTYIKIDQVPGAYIYLTVQGFRPSHKWVNETKDGRQTATPGQWLVRQSVYENGGRSARLRFQRYGASGVVSGVWSPDSVGSYPRLN